LHIDILPLEIGECLTAISNEIIDVPTWSLSLLVAIQVCSIYLLQLLTFQVLLVGHQQVSDELLHPCVYAVSLLSHHE
jgi:hypothetical protein